MNVLYETKSIPKDPDKDTRKAAPAKSAFHDPWEDWQPQWRAAKTKKDIAENADAHAWQERHSPTEAVEIKLGYGKTRATTQRRIADARLWDSLTGQQQDAALEINLAFEMMGRGMGYATSDWTRIPGGFGNVGDVHARLIGDYIAWTKMCHADKVSHSMVIDVLVYGFSCRALDRDRRVRGGTARQNLVEGLMLYAKMKGWHKGP